MRHLLVVLRARRIQRIRERRAIEIAGRSVILRKSRERFLRTELYGDFPESWLVRMRGAR